MLLTNNIIQEVTIATLWNRNGRIHISYYKDNHHFRYSLKLKDTKAGWDKARKIKEQIESTIIYDKLKIMLFGKEKSNEVILLSEAVKLYKQSKGLSENNKCGFYSSTKSLIDVVGDIDIHSVRLAHYNLLYSHLQNKIGYNTIVSYTKHLRTMFNFFIKEKYLSDNPFPIKKMKLKEVRTIPDEHLHSILEELNKNNTETYYIIRLLILTGQRISEAINTQRTDVNYIDKLFTIHNYKAKRQDIFPLYPELEEYFKDLFKAIPNEQFFNQTRHEVYHIFKNTLKKLEIPDYTLHDIRRTFITKYSKILKPLDLMKVARHKDLGTTLDHYIKYDIAELSKKMGNL